MSRKNKLNSKVREQITKVILEQDSQPQKAGVDTPDSPMALRDPDAKARPAKDSVDDQIDALLLRYESASIRKQASLNESLKNLDLRFLFEQEELDDPLAAEDPVEEPADEDSPEGPAGSEDMTVTSPAEEQSVPDLDIDKFTVRVVRLVNNYENLLRTEEAIVNRAKSFLDENYGEVFVSEFINNLSQKYGLDLASDGDSDDIEEENFAVGAFAGGTGGLGGGS